MRVLHVDTGREMRGGQHQVILLINALSGRGVEQMLLARANSPLLNEARRQGWTAEPASVPALWRNSLLADVVHAHDARAHTMASIASRRPFVVSRRVAFPVGRSWLSQWKYKRPAGFLAISQAVSRQLLKAGVPARKIRVVPDGVSCAEFRWEWRPDGKIVTPASSDRRKGTELMRQVAAQLNLPVVFSDQLAEDLREALMFVYLTHSEGLGSAALLAMSMGVPVIASRVEGLAEVFEDEISGLYVENDPVQVIAAIQRLATDSELAARLSSAGRARACEAFGVEAMAERTLEVYRSIV